MLELPKNKGGIPYISYSQYKGWNEAKSFNLRVQGRHEYMLQYFFKEEFGDEMGWADFGQRVEDYICERKHSDTFGELEKCLLDKVEPLGVFQKEILVDFGDFSLLGFIDDATEDFKHLRDYKTASKNSSKRYYKDDYYQLDIYSMWVLQEYGFIPDILEVFIIERTGNPFRGGKLKVGMETWSHFRTTSQERLDFLRKDITRTAKEISQAWEIYNKMLQL